MLKVNNENLPIILFIALALSLIFNCISLIKLKMNPAIVEQQQALLDLQDKIIYNRITKDQIRDTLGKPKYSGRYDNSFYDNYEPPVKNRGFGYWGYDFIYDNSGKVWQIIKHKP